MLYRLAGNRAGAEDLALEAFWRLHRSPPPLVAALGSSPFSPRTVPSALMIAYAALYLLVTLGFALRSVQKRGPVIFPLTSESKQIGLVCR